MNTYWISHEHLTMMENAQPGCDSVDIFCGSDDEFLNYCIEFSKEPDEYVEIKMDKTRSLQLNSFWILQYYLELLKTETNKLIKGILMMSGSVSDMIQWSHNNNIDSKRWVLISIDLVNGIKL